jgi:hypothetical protein
MGEQFHLVNLTGDGCRIARDGCGGYVVSRSSGPSGEWRRVANLPAAYAVCEVFSGRNNLGLPRRLEA